MVVMMTAAIKLRVACGDPRVMASTVVAATAAAVAGATALWLSVVQAVAAAMTNIMSILA
jgi:hypothetical protein